MNTIEDIQKEYIVKIESTNKIRDKIKQREAQIERLKKRLDASYTKSSWTDNIIRPIVNLLAIKFPQISWDKKEDFIPTGMRSNVYVFGEYNKKTIGICFTPTNLEEGKISFDTGKKQGFYAKNSIGSLNGFENVTKVIEDIQDVYNHIEKQLK